MPRQSYDVRSSHQGCRHLRANWIMNRATASRFISSHSGPRVHIAASNALPIADRTSDVKTPSSTYRLIGISQLLPLCHLTIARWVPSLPPRDRLGMLALCHLHDRGPSVTVSLRQAIEIHAGCSSINSVAVRRDWRGIRQIAVQPTTTRTPRLAGGCRSCSVAPPRRETGTPSDRIVTAAPVAPCRRGRRFFELSHLRQSAWPWLRLRGVRQSPPR